MLGDSCECLSAGIDNDECIALLPAIGGGEKRVTTCPPL